MSLSPQAQAVILLTVHLGKGDADAKPLSVKEWGKLARWLKDHELEPANLLKGDPRSLLSGWVDNKITLHRVASLLNRGALLGFALEKWSRAGIWIITRSEHDYPERLKRKLRLDAPPVLFGCGNRALLNKGGVAVVGSRDADEADLEFSTRLAQSAADQGFSVISGGARGVDERAMLGALENEGTSVGVLADSLLRAATSAKYRKYLRAGDLVLISPFNPEARFNVGNAMARNKYIYCLSDAAVVVNSAPDKGGTWSGATEDLKSGWVPLWVQHKDDPASGNAALVQKGARWFPRDLPALSSLWETVNGRDTAPEETSLPLLQQSETEQAPSEAATPHKMAASAGSDDGTADAPPSTDPVATVDAEDSSSEPASEFYSLFLQCLRRLTDDAPMNVEDIATRLELEKAQVNAWLKRGMTDGQIKKLSKPVRYQSASADQRQASLFGNES
ncbi:DNA-processing protein DprA [Oceanicella actignis]|uniref:Predicted Rossmann fold nucleotide-binding protein DprA/Smf involved in DNA uptake n=1 Tax=Oceanicella actignis TaxID=1189325 RepID=A0A1M7U583_9RHOB|nr:DNA-processing protein DprA [Oceanicella actignis]SET87880.1 Predicted Rossmann fold nucleotide-binding protein DprA/Smf involved in DNA uptake [Oceanicella actignis]SHN78113.1 Predicted Rossmann fold nucleotide-binding protein DprA/Smf involved in DNA uptake [Oceanicella actignis]